ncbi:MAG TPA: tyrosinase family protein [Thermoleophilaceae bacterium]
MSNGTPEDRANLARQERDDLLHRKNIDLMSDEEIAAFRRALEGMKQISEEVRSDRRGFFAHAASHGVPDWDCPHHLPDRLFLPWHRAYLYRFEQALQDVVPGVTIPWWDWTQTPRVPEAFDVPEAGGRPNTLFSTRTLVTEADRREGRPVVDETFRNPGAGGRQLPTFERLAQTYAQPSFASFNDDLEGVHDQVHVWTSGTMGDVAYAAFDPLFWAHHCMVDRVWWLWQQENRFPALPVSSQLGTVLEPFNMTVSDTLNANALGYEYAGAEVLLEPVGQTEDDRVVTAPADVASLADVPFMRADLEIGGINQRGSSFEGRVYLNRPDADAGTGYDDGSYAGSFHVFAHGGCFGGEGHCDVPDERRRFDRRPLPPAIRLKKRVQMTEALRKALGAGELSVSIVAIREEGAGGGDDEPLFDARRVSIVLYQ